MIGYVVYRMSKPYAFDTPLVACSRYIGGYASWQLPWRRSRTAIHLLIDPSQGARQIILEFGKEHPMACRE